METPETNEPIVSESEMHIPDSESNPIASAAVQSQLPVILGVLIVLLVLILGGLYLWSTTLTKVAPSTPPPPATRPTAAQNNQPESPTANAQVQALQTVSSSDSIDAISADINSTDLNNIDSGVGSIGNEINAGVSGTSTTGQ